MSDIQYRDIEGFPGYRVGSDGSVWSCRVTLGNQYTGSRGSGIGNTWRRLNPALAGRGYPFVQLRRDGKYHHRYVHRLVLEAFVGPCPTGMECRHFPDADKTNNRLENLKWGTKQENAADKRVHGNNNDGERNGRAKFTDEQAKEIFLACTVNGESRDIVACRFGVAKGTVGDIVCGRNWKHIRRCYEAEFGPAPKLHRRGKSPKSVANVGRRGEANPAARFTDSEVVDIRRECLLDGKPMLRVAKTRGVSYRTIRAIVHGRTWTHLPVSAQEVAKYLEGLGTVSGDDFPCAGGEGLSAPPLPVTDRIATS